jgi:hypothetical protein
MYETQENNDQLVLDYHCHSLIIWEKSLRQYHAELVDAYKNVALIYYWMKSYQESLNYYMRKLNS